MEPLPETEPDQTLIDQLLTTARTLRENNDPFPPVITWQPLTGGPALMTTIDDDPGTDLGDTFARLRSLTGPPDWFAVTIDSYAREQRPGRPPADPGALHDAFINGDPSVVEQIVLIFMDPQDPDPETWRQVYRYTPVDGWEWDRPQQVDAPDDAICTAVRMFH